MTGVKYARSTATRALLVDAAIELIAERGVLATELREVARQAGQRNNSAVLYHFGSRAGLLQAVVDRCVPATIEGPADDTELVHVRCIAQFLASDLWSMVLEDPFVVEQVGRVGSDSQQHWALCVLGSLLPAVTA